SRNRTANRTNPNSKHHDSVTLNDLMFMLPTPNAMDGNNVAEKWEGCESGEIVYSSTGNPRRTTANGSDFGMKLPVMIASMIPSPRTSGLLGGSGSKQMMQDQVDAGVISAEAASGLMGVEMLPTPQSRDHFPPHTPEYVAEKKAIGHGMANLNDQVALLHTPKAHYFKETPENFRARMNRLSGPGDRTNGFPHLMSQIEDGLIGTPKAQDARAALTDRGKHNMGEQVQEFLGATSTGLRLQPAFVEWMMDYPLNYTSLEAETTAWPGSRPSETR
ncbi:MAG: hypothetical protein JO053_13135, partial [Acidobacteria bacterium]|nr:hypothetical protein [Acidobacteriota bacterium]